MAGPSDLEQLLLEYINEARIDPLGDAARFISSYSPLTSNDPDVQNALTFFGVDGSMLLSQLSALTPTQPVAWNDDLAVASRQHDNVMIAANMQSHQLPGELPFDQRDAAAGYLNASTLGENVFSAAQSDLDAQAAFMVDWGSGPGGMQSPAGHRTNIMDADFRELGVGIVQDSAPTSVVGPLVVTEDFGTRPSSGAFILGVAYNDTAHTNFYAMGEGLGNLVVTLGGTSVTSWASGGYTLNTQATGVQTVTFSGAGLSGTVAATVNLAATSNDMFDIVSGSILETAASASVSGPVTTIEGLGATGLSLSTTDAMGHAIVGTKGNDTITGGAGNDTITGGLGNDVINGGGGTNVAVFAGLHSAYAVKTSGGTTTVSGAAGTDTLTNIQFLSFDDGLVTVACFLRGTLILTGTGEVPVEKLRIGDRVVTISGAATPIRWIGRRSYSGHFTFGQKHILPIRIAAGALADGVPRRDLMVSPNHALYLEGVLIEARDLVNGASIRQTTETGTIEYFHIELPDHAVIVAEGAHAESYIDDDNRLLFHNAAEYRALYPAASAGPARYCAPRRDQGYAVERARAAIARRAGLAMPVEATPRAGCAGTRVRLIGAGSPAGPGTMPSRMQG